MTQEEVKRTPDPRTLSPDICGDSFTNPSDMEWVCIREKHTHVERGSDEPPARSHRYIHRWANQPNETKESE